MDSNFLEGKCALVTGSGRGIGKAAAIALAAAGADVIVNYFKDREEAEKTVDEIKKLKVRTVAFQADVSDELSVTHLFAEIKKDFDSIDILVNNAGVSRPQSLDEITLHDWNDIIKTNLTSAFLMIQAALPAMIQKKSGRIINISSVAAQVGGVVGPHYAASKAGMQGLTHYYAAYLASSGITVNSIAPALIETDMIKNNPRVKTGLIPVGRFGLPEEVASVVVMLAANGYITGQTINVNGGWYMS